MKNSNKNIQDRQEKILSLLCEQKEMSIPDLSQALNVSEMTIRRDCSTLSARGQVNQKKAIISYIEPKSKDNQNSLERIHTSLGNEAAKFVKDGEIVFMNSSSTALKALPKLLQKKLYIMTNNLQAAKYISEDDKATLIMSGGDIVHDHLIMSGDIAKNSFSSMRSDWGIIGCAGLSIEHGISTPYLREAAINKTIIKNSRRLILVANYSKFNSFSNFTIGQIKDIDILITDTFASGELVAAIRQEGIQVIQVPQL